MDIQCNYCRNPNTLVSNTLSVKNILLIKYEYCLLEKVYFYID